MLSSGEKACSDKDPSFLCVRITFSASPVPSLQKTSVTSKLDSRSTATRGVDVGGPLAQPLAHCFSHARMVYRLERRGQRPPPVANFRDGSVRGVCKSSLPKNLQSFSSSLGAPIRIRTGGTKRQLPSCSSDHQEADQRSAIETARLAPVG